jgi:hypothetical protein
VYVPSKASPTPDIKRISVRNWLKGKTSTNDDGRIDNEGLSASQNVLLDQDGVIRPWPSLVPYGPQPVGTILGEVAEYKEIDGATETNWMITVQNVAGTARVYIRKDQDAWIMCTGKDYDTTAACRFLQVDDKVLVCNGVDNLSFLDIPTKTVTPFTQVDTPSNGGAVKTGLTNNTYPLSYKVTASNQGQSAASAEITVSVGKIRGNLWIGGTDFVTITADRETNAQFYHVYIKDAYTAGTGDWEYIGSVRDPGGVATTWSFVDNGTVAPDYTRTAPIGDSSAGPKAKRAASVNGQVFLIGNPDAPREIYYGGNTIGNELNFSPFGGGGSLQVGAGGKELPSRIIGFRNGQGQPAITVLCRTTGGRGKRYLLSPQTTTIGTTVIDFFQVTEDNGEDGTDAPDGVLLYRDALWYPSVDGFKTTYTKQQIQNILSTDSVSGGIRPDVNNISLAHLDKAVGVAYRDRLYWALPVGADHNNQIWTLDLERGRGWMLPRYVNADWLFTYEDNGGNARMLCLQDNMIMQFSYASLTNDNGTPFSTYARSGIIKFSEDGLMWSQVLRVTFVFLRPRGEIQVQVDGLLEDEEQSQSLNTDAYITADEIAGWGESGFSDPTNGWSETLDVPTGSAVTRKIKSVEIDEEMQWLQWSVKTTKSGCDYSLSDVIIEHVPTNLKDLTL